MAFMHSYGYNRTSILQRSVRHTIRDETHQELPHLLRTHGQRQLLFGQLELLPQLLQLHILRNIWEAALIGASPYERMV